jgi:hypothetical protein
VPQSPRASGTARPGEGGVNGCGNLPSVFGTLPQPLVCGPARGLYLRDLWEPWGRWGSEGHGRKVRAAIRAATRAVIRAATRAVIRDAR